MKKIVSIIIIILMIMGITFMPTKAYANFNIENADLYSKGIYSDYLHFGDVGIVFNYVVYLKDGIEYPAYCLNKDLDGVTESYTYSVSTEELISNVEVWRAIINGYPYKTATELGCYTNEEAFIATKQAVYCMLYDRSPDEYQANNEREERVLNAVTQIVSNAKNSSQVKQSADLTINDVTASWEPDILDEEFVSKTFTVSANAPISSYSISLENLILKGIKIVDEKNEEKSEFLSGHNFKILIPISNFNKKGSFTIKVEGKVATKPVLYGYSTDRSFQDYAITGSIYENGNGAKIVYYDENKTEITIIKEDENGNRLEGVKFCLLDENKGIVYSDLTTNANGEIIIKNLKPGKYYIKEISTLNGYEKNGEVIETIVAYNEKITATITNHKKTIEVEKPKTAKDNIQVVSKLPKTGM